jgi:tetratricopeptide (TPR) repeat protein
MALRVIDSVPTADPLRVGRIDVAERAAAHLADGDVIAYRALYEEAAALASQQRRYEARTALLAAGFQATAESTRPVAVRLFGLLAEQSLAMLEDEPAEPVVLNGAGVAFYELGAIEAAETLFGAAKRLDPALEHVDDNLRSAAARRDRQGPVLPPAMATALPALAERTRRVAAAAQPTDGLRISLCMIVRDEEEMLGRCLESVRGAVDEIVVVDTGSLDRTAEIAHSHGATVIEREWTGSFAEARNASLEAANGDWILYLDADEALAPGDADQLRELARRTWREAYYLSEKSWVGAIDDGIGVTHNALRMFRNRPQYRFEGRIHEQIGHSLPLHLAERVELTRVRIEHYGYLGVVRDAKDKSARNIELLERELAEAGPSPFLNFNLGSEYAALGDAARAVKYLGSAWESLRGRPEAGVLPYVPTLVSRLVRSLREAGHPAAARELADQGLELFPAFTDLVLEQAQAARNQGEVETAIALLERCLEMGDAPARYTATLGTGTYLPLVSLAGIRRAEGELEEAERLLTRALREHPRLLGAVDPLAQTMLARGAEPEEVVATVADCVAELTPSVRFALGLALYEAGCAAHAEQEFRAVVERQPANDVARAALAEALLTQRRWNEVIELAAERGSGTPSAVALLRAALFARVVSGDVRRAAALLSQNRAELSEDELEAFEAWCAVARGDGGPRALSETVAEPLYTLFEALLRVEEVDHAVRILRVLERVCVPERERRERLAGIYLRRGFLKSAADEWIATCERQGPDPGALLGLAQVAIARGLPEEARVFAHEALTLDAGSHGARQLLAQLGGA